MKLAPTSKCSACMACIDACSHRVLDAILDEQSGFFKIKAVNIDACTNCGLCTKSCPILTPPQRQKIISSLAVWTINDDLRRKCASGGAFGAMASQIIEGGGVAVGATIKGFDIIHSTAETASDLIPLLGSKYQHSDTRGIYRIVRHLLIQGRMVLFSGLSCQVAGLKAFLGDKPYPNLITVDTICGGLSTMLPMLALKNSGKYTAIASFRDKENGWRAQGFKYALKMQCSDGFIENLGLDNPVLNTFSSKLLKRANCLNCQFNGAERVADITIGDFWADTTNRDQHAKGLSVAIVRSQKALELVHESLQSRQTTIDAIVAGNPNLLGGRYPLVKYIPTRNKALKLQKEQRFAEAQHLMSPNTLPGILLRIALKIK